MDYFFSCSLLRFLNLKKSTEFHTFAINFNKNLASVIRRLKSQFKECQSH